MEFQLKFAHWEHHSLSFHIWLLQGRIQTQLQAEAYWISPSTQIQSSQVKKTPLPCCIENNQNHTKVTPKKFGHQITLNTFMRAIKFLNLRSSGAGNMCEIRLPLNFSQTTCTGKCSFVKLSVSPCQQWLLYPAGQVASTSSNWSSTASKSQEFNTILYLKFAPQDKSKNNSTSGN